MMSGVIFTNLKQGMLTTTSRHHLTHHIEQDQRGRVPYGAGKMNREFKNETSAFRSAHCSALHASSPAPSDADFQMVRGGGGVKNRRFRTA